MSMAIIPKVSTPLTRLPCSILTSRFFSCALDVQRAIDVAFKYRNFFRKDIIVDLIVYRRWSVRSAYSL